MVRRGLRNAVGELDREARAGRGGCPLRQPGLGFVGGRDARRGGATASVRRRGQRIEAEPGHPLERRSRVRAERRRAPRPAPLSGAGLQTPVPAQTHRRTSGRRPAGSGRAFPRPLRRTRKAFRLPLPAHREHRPPARAPQRPRVLERPGCAAAARRVGWSSSCNVANGSSDSFSTPVAPICRMSPPRSRASSRSAVLPTPGSPTTASAPLCPRRASSHSAAIPAQALAPVRSACRRRIVVDY